MYPRITSRRGESLTLFSGPSAIGKTSVVNLLTAEWPTRFCRPRSFTTRPRRQNEDASEYEFVSEDAMRRLHGSGALLNLDEVYGHLYAIARESVESALVRGRSPVKEVHPANVRKIRSGGLPVCSVLLLPTDWESWRVRATSRDRERAEIDECFYRSLDASTFDIVRLVPPGESERDVAIGLARSIRCFVASEAHAPTPGTIDDTNRAGYDAVAGEFDASRRPTTDNFHTLSRPFFAEQIRLLSVDSRCVELGPGQGWLRKEFDWPSVRYDGLDVSPLMAHLASSDAITTGSARAMPWASNTFDVAIASLADPFLFPTALAEIRRVIRRSGRFVFSTIAREWSREIRPPAADDRTSFQLSGGGTADVWSFAYNADDLPALLADADLELVRISTLTGAPLVGGAAPAISKAAANRGVSISELQILHTVIAEAV